MTSRRTGLHTMASPGTPNAPASGPTERTALCAWESNTGRVCGKPFHQVRRTQRHCPDHRGPLPRPATPNERDLVLTLLLEPSFSRNDFRSRKVARQANVDVYRINWLLRDLVDRGLLTVRLDGDERWYRVSNLPALELEQAVTRMQALRDTHPLVRP